MAKPFSHKWPTEVIKSHELATEGWPRIEDHSFGFSLCRLHWCILASSC